MGEEEETKTEVKESVTNGTVSEKAVENVVEKKEGETGVNEMHEGAKGENHKKIVEKEAEVKEEPKTEAMEEEDPKVVDKGVKEDGETEAMEEENNLTEVEKEAVKNVKTESLDEKMDEIMEDKDENVKDSVEGKEEEKEEAKEGEEAKKEKKEKGEFKAIEETKESEEVKESKEVKESDEANESEEEKEDKKEKDKKEDKGSAEEKGSRKRSRAKSDLGKSSDSKKKVVEKELEPRTPVTNRPVREKKSVERLVATIEKDNSGEFHIEKGSGTQLKEIPNVAYQLSMKRNNNTFMLLHTILYGRRGKAGRIKHNMSRFSGFVWHENEEKQKLKVKEKFDRIVKEKLLDYCDVLDIPMNRTTSRKEDIVVKLLDFLVAPHATTTVSLAEQDPGKKRKRSATKGGFTSTSSKGSSKNRKKIGDTSKEGEKATQLTDDVSEEDGEEEKVNGTVKRSKDENSDHSVSEEKNDASENDSEEETVKEKASAKKSKKETKKKTPSVASSGKGTSKKVITPTKPRSIPKGSARKLSASSFKTGEGNDPTPTVFSRKKMTEEPKREKSSGSKKSSAKGTSGAKAVKGKVKPKEDKLKPSDDVLKYAIGDILKQADFNTTTFTDILKQLAKKFSADLTPRKAAIKFMIQDELTKLSASSFKTGEGNDPTPKVFSRKKKTEEPKREKSSGSKKSSAKETSGAKAVKGKVKPKEDKLKPSDYLLKHAIFDILKQVDFNTPRYSVQILLQERQQLSL